MPDFRKILFVCVENSARSQMAEGFFRKFAQRGFESISAGTKPTTTVNSLATEVMNEVGIDISSQQPKSLSDQVIQHSYKIVNMGCMDRESCPALFANNLIDWKIEDPKGKPIENMRKIRDEIEEKVKELVKNLESK